MLDIHRLMAGLATTRKVFHSEADFQHALAWQIHKTMPKSQIRLEVNVTQAEDKKMFLDIWLPVEGIAIELKYKTQVLEVEQDDESFALRNHNARDQGCYYFLRDVQRLETMCSDIERCKGGYAVLLTNESLYWKTPPHPNTADANFRIHEGQEISGSLKWAGNPSPGTTQGRESPIQIQGSYRLHWREYSNFAVMSYGSFRYLAVSVE